jgi:hypothetical protein
LGAGAVPEVAGALPEVVAGPPVPAGALPELVGGVDAGADLAGAALEDVLELTGLDAPVAFGAGALDALDDGLALVDGADAFGAGALAGVLEELVGLVPFDVGVLDEAGALDELGDGLDGAALLPAEAGAGLLEEPLAGGAVLGAFGALVVDEPAAEPAVLAPPEAAVEAGGLVAAGLVASAAPTDVAPLAGAGCAAPPVVFAADLVEELGAAAGALACAAEGVLTDVDGADEGAASATSATIRTVATGSIKLSRTRTQRCARREHDMERTRHGSTHPCASQGSRASTTLNCTHMEGHGQCARSVVSVTLNYKCELRT